MAPDMEMLRTVYQVRQCMRSTPELCAGMVSRLSKEYHMEARAPVGHKSSHNMLPTGGRTPRRHKWTQLEDARLRAAVQVRICIDKCRMAFSAKHQYLITKKGWVCRRHAAPQCAAAKCLMQTSESAEARGGQLARGRG